MFYSVFLVMLGVYLGQEYNIPSVGLLLTRGIEYTQHLIQQNELNQQSYITRIYRYFIGRT